MPRILVVQKSTLCRFSGRLIFSEVSAWHPLHLLVMVSHGSQYGNSKMFHTGWPPTYTTGEPHHHSSPVLLLEGN